MSAFEKRGGQGGRSGPPVGGFRGAKAPRRIVVPSSREASAPRRPLIRGMTGPGTPSFLATEPPS